MDSIRRGLQWRFWKRSEEAVPKEFIVGIRWEPFEPALADDNSVMPNFWRNTGLIFWIFPMDFPGKMSLVLRKRFSIQRCDPCRGGDQKACIGSVFAVNSITDARMAEDILERTGVDMADIGRVCWSTITGPSMRKRRSTGRRLALQRMPVEDRCRKNVQEGSC